jgi:DNA-binding CsgD family transcriptional regulator
VSTLHAAREAMAAELASAFAERDVRRVEAAATWLCSTGSALADVYEVLLDAALREVPSYPRTPAEHVRAFEMQESVRDLIARLAPPPPATSLGQVLLVVPGGSRWVLGTAALSHLLEDAGYNAVSSDALELDDVEPTLATLPDPVAVCLALHDVSYVPKAREVVRRVRAAYPLLRVIVGGKVNDIVNDLAGLVGAHAASRSLRQTLQLLDGTSNPLSPRELAVLTCVARGMSNPDAGQHLGVAPATVKTHLDRVYAKLGTSDRTATVALAMRRGWID